MKTIHKYLLTACILVIAVTSCITKKYQKPAAETTKLYREITTTDTATLADVPWQNLFADTILQGLIREGLNNNLEVKIAIQRLAAAQASFNQSKAAFLPTLSAGTTVNPSRASRASLNLPPGAGIKLGTTIYQAQFSSSWEADIWGKLSSARRSAFASLLETEAAKRAIQTQLIASIANTYYYLLALDKQLQITEQTVSSRTVEAATMKELKEAAVVNGAAVVQSEANQYAAEVSVPDLKETIRETENSLSILLGRAPENIKRSTIDEQVITSDLQTGVPAQLLHNRPDIQQAEFAFRASFENTNLARTYFYPALTITAEGGLSTLKLTDFFNGSVFYNLIGGLTQPIFSGGVNKARLKTAQEQQMEALYNYQNSLLKAGQEVSDDLYSYQAAKEKEAIRAKQLVALVQSVEFTKDLLRYSSATNYTDVLTSEQSLLAAQLSSVNDRLQQLQSVVNLYQALGGGWKTQP
jgi:multidrug efflux system outer membrane protein